MRGKELAIFFVVLLIVSGVVAGIYWNLSSGTTRYYNKEKGFSIELPSNWEVEENTNGKMAIMALSPTRECINVVTGELSEPLSVDQYYELRVRFEEHGDGHLTIDNRPARWRIISRQVDSRRVMAVQYMLVDGLRVYVIGGVARPERFPKYRDKFKEIAKSFKLE